MENKIILTALCFGALSILFGAFGAHALKKILTPDQLISFEVAVRYLMYSAFFLLFISTTNTLFLEQKNNVFYVATLGTILFSGSIFLLSTSSITKINFKFLGPITPIGGLLLITSWVLVFYYIFTKKS